MILEVHFLVKYPRDASWTGRKTVSSLADVLRRVVDAGNESKGVAMIGRQCLLLRMV